MTNIPTTCYRYCWSFYPKRIFIITNNPIVCQGIGNNWKISFFF